MKFITKIMLIIFMLFLSFIVYVIVNIDYSEIGENWEFRELKDEVTDDVSYIAVSFITNDKYIYVDCNNFDLIQKDKEKTSKDYNVDAIFRVDKNKAVEYIALTNNKTYRFYNVTDQLNEMKQGDELIIRLYDKNKFYEDFKIKLKGFAEAYDQLQKSCK